MTSLISVFFYCSVFATAWALLRARTGLFFLALNQVVVLRALDGIVRYGQPRSQAFLPIVLFSPSNIETVVGIFSISVPLTLLFVLLPDAAGPRRADPVLPALPRWALWLLGSYFLVFIASTRTIFTVAYATSEQVVFNAPSGGVQALATGLVIYEFYRRVKFETWSPYRASGALTALLFFTDYSKGTTGFATSFLIVGTVLFFSGRRGFRRRVFPALSVLALAGVLTMIVRTARQSLHTGEGAAVAAAAETISTAEQRRAETGEGLEDRMNGAQVAAHALECAWLYDNGRSREWRSIYNPIIYTFQPAFLLKPLGIVRPKEAAWELGEYFIHGGGILVFGEMYWNGGYLCVFVVTLAMIALAWYVDTRRDGSLWIMLLACNFTPMLLQGTQYGIAYSMRGMANGLLASILMIPLYLAASRRGACREGRMTGHSPHFAFSAPRAATRSADVKNRSNAMTS